MVSKALVLGSIVGWAAAQFPPTPEGVRTIKSKFHENVTISFKEVGGSLKPLSPRLTGFENARS